MARLLNYGRQGSLAIDGNESAPPKVFDAPRGSGIVSIDEAVDDALAAPLGYPPLARAVVEGDHVVVALEPGVPQAAKIIGAVVTYLVRAGVSPADITVLQTKAEVEAQTDEAADAMAEVLPHGVNSVVHDPEERAQLSFLAATRQGRPVYLNRMLCDADVVVPIGCFNGQRNRELYGIHAGLYPTFSDAETQRRYRDPRLADPELDIRQRAQREADRVDWLSGIRLCVQVVPGGADELLHIVAGDIEQVLPAAAGLWQSAWEFESPERASLVVASISGTCTAECWDQIAQALVACEAVAAADGKIALCTDVDLEPGPALQLLANHNDRHQALREIRKARLPDASLAIALDRAQQQGRVYWLSQLDEDFVSELGVTPISDPADIERLIRRSDSCTVLANAHRMMLVPPAVGARP